MSHQIRLLLCFCSVSVLFSFDPNPVARLTVWNMVLALGFDSMGTYGWSQSAVQRYSNVGSMGKARLYVDMTFTIYMVIITIDIMLW